MSLDSRLAVPVVLWLGVVGRLAAQEPHPHQAEALGRVVFPVSCTPEAQTRFEQAMALLHSFWWEEGGRAFRAVAASDSTCALAYWGLALNYWGNPFVGGPSGDDLRQGAVAAVRGRALGAPTARERGFLAATGALYRDHETTPNSRRLLAYSDTLARVYRDFPDDPEVAIYYALSLVATASPTDTTFTRQRQAAAILNPLFRRFPEHPGLAQYIPSHIFVRLGLWDESIAANQRSFDAGVAYARAQRLGGVGGEQFHALDYMVYAYLQEGRDSTARRTVAQGLAASAVGSNDGLLANYNRVAMEARVPLEQGDWAAAARLPVRAAGQGGIGEALAHFARGIGAARSRDTTQARAEVAALA